jgi:uncharacterized membrane protein YphA (DoxX/SURF4 family)
LFSAFPGAWPGIALLLLRAVLGLALLIQGTFYLRQPNAPLSAWFVGGMAITAGTLLLVGFLTPITGAVVALSSVGVGISVLPRSSPSLFETKLSIVFAITMLVAVILLGPGALSVDARVFGRREIIIPSPPPRSRR